MSRYAGIKELKQIIYDNVFGSDNRNHINELIDSAPSIEIIHCGECKYWKESQYYSEFMVCTYVKGATFTRQHDDFCSRGERNSSEKPNNCEHITEDGVTCAKYPACDDCIDNPLNKVKGSERLVKGSERSSE